jgi:hypothetical protein
MTEASKIMMVKNFWLHSEEGLRSEFARMSQGFRFYTGDQWDPADLEKLTAEKRPALTINLILPIINLLAGIQRQGRQDITVTARKGGLAPLASAYTQVLRHCLDRTDADYELADAFLDGLIGSKGWLGLDIDHTEDPVYGDIALHKVSPFAMREDPDAKEYDLNKSGKFVIRDQWMDKEALALNWPKLEKEINSGGLATDPAGGDVKGDAERGSLRWRVRQCWWKSYEKRLIMINAATGAMKAIDPLQRELVYAISKRRPTWAVKEWVVPVLNLTVTAGNLVLTDVKDPYRGVTTFPYYRFCPFWVDGYVMGVVQNLIGPQQEVNKRRSQALHNLNQTANSGYKIKKALNNYDRHIAKHGATPGVVLDESKAGGSIERITPAPLSEGHIQAAALSADDMKEISGANPDLMGQLIENHAESGKAIELRQAQGMKVVEVLFDNFARTQKLIALGLVDMIRFTDVYSDEEINAILSDGQDGRRQNTEDRRQNNTNILTLLKDRKVGRYGIKIESSSSSPTAQYANFLSILEIARMYPEQLGADVVIENSTLANKELILQKVRTAARTQEPMNSRTQEKEKRLKASKDFVNMIT